MWFIQSVIAKVMKSRTGWACNSTSVGALAAQAIHVSIPLGKRSFPRPNRRWKINVSLKINRLWEWEMDEAGWGSYSVRFDISCVEPSGSINGGQCLGQPIAFQLCKDDLSLLINCWFQSFRLWAILPSGMWNQQHDNLPTFRRDILLPSSGSQRKSSKQTVPVWGHQLVSRHRCHNHCPWYCVRCLSDSN